MVSTLSRSFSMSQIVSDWRTATRLLIETNDLDPMYPVIKQIREDYEDEWYYQYLMYYTLFYDPRGAVGAIDIDPEDFWNYVRLKASLSATRRGKERRHFRTDNAKKALDVLADMGSPTDIFTSMYKPTYTALYENIRDNFQGTSIGPYFTWKIMDFFNVCSDLPVSLTTDEAWRYMPEQPKSTAIDKFGGLEGAINVNN